MEEQYTFLEYIERPINSYAVVEYNHKKYIVMHVVKEKYGIYDYEYHDVLKVFKWTSDNGYFVTFIQEEHKEMFPDMSYDIGKKIKMDRLIMEYLFGLLDPKTKESKRKTENYVIEHINGATRDSRIDNLRWITRRHYDDVRHPKFYWKKIPKQLKDMGMVEYPKYIKWLERKNAFVIDDHPLKLLDHEVDRRNKIRIYSSAAKNKTPHDKFIEITNALEELEKREYLGFPSFAFFKNVQIKLKESHDIIITNTKTNIISRNMILE